MKGGRQSLCGRARARVKHVGYLLGTDYPKLNTKPDVSRRYLFPHLTMHARGLTQALRQTGTARCALPDWRLLRERLAVFHACGGQVRRPSKSSPTRGGAAWKEEAHVVVRQHAPAARAEHETTVRCRCRDARGGAPRAGHRGIDAPRARDGARRHRHGLEPRRCREPLLALCLCRRSGGAVRRGGHAVRASGHRLLRRRAPRSLQRSARGRARAEDARHRRSMCVRTRPPTVGDSPL